MTAGDWINSFVALATFGMAIATYYLAKDAADATKQADRHHQKSQRPFYVITFSNAGQRRPFGPDFDPELRRQCMPAGVTSGQLSNSDIPIFLTGTQAVRTLADVQTLPPTFTQLDDDRHF